MPLDRLEVRVSIQKVLIALVLVIVPLSIVGLYLTSRSDRALDASTGTSFKNIAQLYSKDISHGLTDRVSAVTLLSAEPNVVEAVLAQDRNYRGHDEEAVSNKLKDIENTWTSPKSAPMVKDLLASKVSGTLRHYRELDSQLLRVIVTDERGVAVAATHKPTKYVQSQEEAWQSAYSSGQGSIYISDILYDEPTKAYYVNVGVPIPEPGTGQVAGVVMSAVNITPVLATFQEDALGNGTRASLVKEDGTVVSGLHTDVFARTRSDEFGAIGESLGTMQGRQTGYVTADTGNGRRIIGFADTGLKKMSKNLDWTVIVSQPEREAAAALRPLEQFALWMVVLGLLMLTLMAVFYALHRTQRFEDIEHPLGAQPAHP